MGKTRLTSKYKYEVTVRIKGKQELYQRTKTKSEAQKMAKRLQGIMQNPRVRKRG